MRLVGLFAWAVGAGCAAYPKSAAVPAAITDADVRLAAEKWPDGVTQEKLETGRKLFAEKCNHCHEYPDIRSVEEHAWPPILKRMGKRAGLDDAQIDDVGRFVLVARLRP
jgi:cytochrome c5